MTFLLLNQRGREEEREDCAQPEFVAYVHRRRGVEVIEHELDPLMKERGAETAEVFSEGKVAEDVEAGEMVPFADLDAVCVFMLGFVGKALDEEIEQAPKDGFLLDDGLLRKGWIESSADAAVALVVCEGNGILLN